MTTNRNLHCDHLEVFLKICLQPQKFVISKIRKTFKNKNKFLFEIQVHAKIM